jgi:hypothetical protein
MRKAALTAAVMVSARVLTLWFWRLSPLLPERGGTTCFAADYTPPRPIDLTSPRRDKQSIGEVSSMRIEIHFPPDETPFRNSKDGGYDWRYSLRLGARMTKGDRLSAAAICEARDTFFDRIVPAQFCYIDCDGGSVTVWREFGQSALSVRFEAGERLKAAAKVIRCLSGRKARRGAFRRTWAESCK